MRKFVGFSYEKQISTICDEFGPIDWDEVKSFKEFIKNSKLDYNSVPVWERPFLAGYLPLGELRDKWIKGENIDIDS